MRNENIESIFIPHLSLSSRCLYYFVPDTCFQSQTASFSSFFFLSFARRQIHPPSCTLTLYKRFSSSVDEKRNYLALERNCPCWHGLFYSSALSDSVSSHLTFFYSNLPCAEYLLNGKGNEFKYFGAAFIFNLNKTEGKQGVCEAAPRSPAYGLKCLIACNESFHSL